MVGTVTELSKLPISPEGLRLLLNNDDLVRHFSKEGPVFVVRVQLKVDPATRSGYAWTSDRGVDVPAGVGKLRDRRGSSEIAAAHQPCPFQLCDGGPGFERNQLQRLRDRGTVR